MEICMLRSRHRFEIGDLVTKLIKNSIGVVFVIMLLILTIKGALREDIMKAFSISKDEGLFWLLSSISKISILGIDLLWLVFYASTTIFIFGLLLIVKNYYKEKLLLIQHNSFNAMNFLVAESELKDYSIKKLNLNQCKIMRDSTICLREKINLAILEQEIFLKQVNMYISKGYSLAYVGIGHTPLIFLLGFQIGDENETKIFHKRHCDLNDQQFHLLLPDHFSETMTRYPQNIIKKKYDSIIICIETASIITDDDISFFRKRNDLVLRYATANKGSDVIYSSKQIDEYIKKITDDLSEICKTYNIRVAKLFIASSVAFTFALARSISNNYHPDIVVFHYDSKSKLKYPWGIHVTKKEAIVTSINDKLVI